MTRILSLDPGHTTGIAVYNEAGNLEFSMTVTSRGLESRDFFCHLTDMAKPDVVLVEGLPSHTVDAETSINHQAISHWFKTAGYTLISVKPGQWKHLVERVEIPGQHARDAATMAKWYVQSQEGK